MIQTLQRDSWKLIGLMLLSGGLYVLNIMALTSRLMTVVLLLGIVNWFLTRILPACFYERKNLWNIAWKYLAWRLLLELLVELLTKAGVPYGSIRYPAMIVGEAIFLGFLCAAANATGLWSGIKTLMRKHFIKYVIIFVFMLLYTRLGLLLVKNNVFVLGVWGAFINILVVYMCLPLFKNK